MSSIVETYVKYLSCANCFNNQFFSIPKGVSVSLFFSESSHMCSYCGCKFIPVKKIVGVDA